MTHNDTMTVDLPATPATEKRGVFASKDLLGASGMVVSWKTPMPLFQSLNAEFGFTVDVCASDWNHQCARYWTVKDDGLSKEWDGACWCNPPFDESKARWVEKAWRSAQAGATVVMLLKADFLADSEWWHDYVMRSSEIRYMRGRPTFAGMDGKTTSQRCLIVVMRPGCQGPPILSSVDKDGRAYAPNTQAQPRGN